MPCIMCFWLNASRQCLNRKFESDLESRFRNFLRDAAPVEVMLSALSFWSKGKFDCFSRR